MNSLIETDINELGNFNYKQLDIDTANKLKDITIELSATNSNFKYNVGKQLNKAQELLAKKGYGCFGEWFQSYGLKKDKVYDWIRYYKVFAGNPDKQKLKKISDSKIYEIGKLNTEQQKEILESADLENMTTQQVKELTKQLREEQEYSEELQQAIKEKENKIRELQDKIETIQIPEKEIIEKEVVKEIVPKNLILEKQSLEKELETLRKRAEKAENTLSRMKLNKEINQDKIYTNVKLDSLLVNIKDFLDNASKYTYLKSELQDIPLQNKKILENKINEVESWAILMKQALRNEESIVGNVIFGEGEIINE